MIQEKMNNMLLLFYQDFTLKLSLSAGSRSKYYSCKTSDFQSQAKYISIFIHEVSNYKTHMKVKAKVCKVNKISFFNFTTVILILQL